MGFTKLTKDMAVIAALDNEPNDVGGLTAEELKSKFDEAGKAVQQYLNEVLLKELEGALAAEKLGAVLRNVETTVQSAIDTLSADMAGIVLGTLPEGSITEEKLHPSLRAAFAPAYTVSTQDLTAGESPLATGALHLVYE